tara:strand:+ start:4046 stop:4615 length:570 start_codon:yes stop_codon:yes gene_type:complete
MIKQTLACLLGLSLSTTALAAEATNPTSTSTVAYEDIKSIPLSWSYRKGLRFGYNYVNKGADKTALNDDPRLSSPHMFAIGFEMQQTMAGGDWLDILFIQNVTISGLEQSLVIPSANALVGFEINRKLQAGVGVNVAPVDPADDGNLIHLVTAIGWTQPAGSLSVPLHLVFIPDVNDYWRCAVTTGVNW